MASFINSISLTKAGHLFVQISPSKETSFHHFLSLAKYKFLVRQYLVITLFLSQSGKVRGGGFGRMTIIIQLKSLISLCCSI